MQTKRVDAKWTAANGIERTRGDEADLRDQLVALVRRRPWAGIATAGIAGALLGGFVLSRASRLLFVAMVGYVAHGLWQGEGRLDIDDLAARFGSQRGREHPKRRHDKHDKE